ncbi:hypothetical protein IPA_01525 [Ignicoccus pacificus DSM 13166]|uniref:DUF2283 domain-containing protein n=1 Tax=Ignicoccus pacificus DSM 13166 TaxID=940294 RepID=A0A977PJ36_9CREN|nr:hypothetical protein IPA_01525 [Ignicoccus pacificus DSM 13166]
MSVEYDKETDTLLIKLKDVDKLDYAEEIGNAIVHFKDGEVVEIEILNASKVLCKEYLRLIPTIIFP